MCLNQGYFLVSSPAANAETSPHIKAESLALLGDALFREREYRRAIHNYKQALQYYKIIPKQNSTSSRSSLPPNRSSSPNSFNISAINENEVKFKIASCHSALSENRAAIGEMEGIPGKARNLQMNLLMGKLYRISRHIRPAISCYKECLRHCPFVLEAITALAEMGATAKDIISLFPQTPYKSGRAPFDHFDSSRWLQARLIDPYIVTYMDEYAILLKKKSDYSKLNKLAHDLLSIEPTRPEALVTLSALWERKDGGKALTYVDQSIRIDERHIPCYIMKGHLLLTTKQAESAVIAFRGAQELRPDIRSYEGLVHSYLALSKTKEALYAAREAMKAMPQSAKALKLVGDVHAINSSGREKAKKFYESALRLEPGYLGAALALAELHVIEGRNGDAVSLLERYLKDWADDSLHVKLAQVFAATNMLQDALLHYQSALRINPQNEAAKKGLERLEKQMKGVDPDAPEEDEENEVEDADGDLEETDLL
uniref:Anaphase-promoting complex subunit 7 n=1 Tax=Fagus sylvatica TaxID=28930 RepID=A0A2N9J0J6_FAGSY